MVQTARCRYPGPLEVPVIRRGRISPRLKNTDGPSLFGTFRPAHNILAHGIATESTYKKTVGLESKTQPPVPKENKRASRPHRMATQQTENTRNTEHYSTITGRANDPIRKPSTLFVLPGRHNCDSVGRASCAVCHRRRFSHSA